jgi:hypothetical protein
MFVYICFLYIVSVIYLFSTFDYKICIKNLVPQNINS